MSLQKHGERETNIIILPCSFSFIIFFGEKMMMIFEAPLQIFIFAFNKYLRGKVFFSLFYAIEKEERFRRRFKENKLKNFKTCKFNYLSERQEIIFVH